MWTFLKTEKTVDQTISLFHRSSGNRSKDEKWCHPWVVIIFIIFFIICIPLCDLFDSYDEYIIAFEPKIQNFPSIHDSEDK